MSFVRRYSFPNRPPLWRFLQHDVRFSRNTNRGWKRRRIRTNPKNFEKSERNVHPRNSTKWETNPSAQTDRRGNLLKIKNEMFHFLSTIKLFLENKVRVCVYPGILYKDRQTVLLFLKFGEGLGFVLHWVPCLTFECELCPTPCASLKVKARGKGGPIVSRRPARALANKIEINFKCN